MNIPRTIRLAGVVLTGIHSPPTLIADPLPPVELPSIQIALFAPPPSRPAAPPLPTRPMEAIAPSLDAAPNAHAVLGQTGIVLTDGQKRFLDEHRFLLVPIAGTALAAKQSDDPAVSGDDEMLAAFDRIAGDVSFPENHSPGAAKLVTPDIVLHAWHRYFSHLLEYVEGVQMRPRLEKLLMRCMANAALLSADQPKEVQARLDWVNAQYSVAWVLLGTDEETPRPQSSGKPASDPNPDPDLEADRKWRRSVDAEMAAARPPSDPRSWKQRLTFAKSRLPKEVAAAMQEEVRLAMEGTMMTESPLFELYTPTKRQDYTQLRPRSHYTKSAALRGWFRSMMYLGRSGINLTTEAGLRDALLSALVLCEPGFDGVAPIVEWRQIMEVSAFFGGQSDDITYPEFREWATRVLDRTSFDSTMALQSDVLTELRERRGELRRPAINSAAHDGARPSPEHAIEFRIFGQRFGWDAWVIDGLLDTDGSGSLPTIVSGTTVMAAFGSDAAAEAARAFLVDIYGDDASAYITDFDGKLPGLRKKLAAVSDESWFTSMAAQQLRTIGTLAPPRSGENMPQYLRSPLFSRRQLSCMMGSWTELKHDTVLYAKQNYAELGEGADQSENPPPPPRGFVQPDIEFWTEMERLARFTADGLRLHHLLPDAGEEFSVMHTFADQMHFLRLAAIKEVAGEALTDDDHDAIWRMSFLGMDQPIEQNTVGASPDRDRGKTAVVTDVLTDASHGRVLQVATGRPLVMLALVGNENAPRLVAGLVHDSYEFIGPMANRLTDEEWRRGLYTPSPEMSRRPSWAVPVPETSPVNSSH